VEALFRQGDRHRSLKEAVALERVLGGTRRLSISSARDGFRDEGSFLIERCVFAQLEEYREDGKNAHRDRVCEKGENSVVGGDAR